MAKKIKLIGAKIRHWNTQMTDKIVFHRVHCSCALTETLADKMGWLCLYSNETPSEGWESTKLSGEFSLQNLSMVADGMQQHSFEVSAHSAADFQAVRVDGLLELRFTVRTEDRSTAIEEYWRIVGDGLGVMTLGGAAEQQRLDEEAPEAEPDQKEALRPKLTKVGKGA